MSITAIARQIIAPSTTTEYAWAGSLNRNERTGTVRVPLLCNRDDAGELVLDRAKAWALLDALRWQLEGGND